MGPENQNPLDELQSLDEQIGQTTELAGLKPIFFRLDELAKAHPGDFEVQLSVTELKQKVVTRGTALKQLGQMMQGDVPGSDRDDLRDLNHFAAAPADAHRDAEDADRARPASAASSFAAVSSAFQAPPVAPPGDIRRLRLPGTPGG